jgi:hypothetical protein
VESTSAAHSHATTVETSAGKTPTAVEATATTTVETTATETTTTVAATATAATAGLSFGYKQTTNQRSGHQDSHRSFQHVSPYVKRLISLGFKWTLGHFRPTANSAIVSNENRRTSCRHH